MPSISRTKLIPSWLAGLRDAECAKAFVCQLAGRLSERIHIASNGLKVHDEAMEAGFGGDVDYAILHKVHGSPTSDEARYSPADCVGCQKLVGCGDPDLMLASTCYTSRQNLTMRMRMRRFTRLTNAFSRKLENHEYAVALNFFVYNFIARHGRLRMPPASKVGVAGHCWTYEELVEMIDRCIPD